MKSTLRIALIYGVFGVAWIALSDLFIASIAGDPRRITLLQTLKGWIFVLGSTLLLYYALRREMRIRKAAEDARRHSESILAQAGKVTSLGGWMIDISDPDDLNANPLHWSDETYRIFGYQPGEVEVTNDLFFERVHPEDRQLIVDSVAKAIAHKEPYRIEHRVIRPDGTEIMVREHCEIAFDEQGRPATMIGAVQDITGEKRAQEALMESENKFMAIFTGATDGILLADTKSRTFITGNPAIARMLGYASEELAGLGIMDIHPAGDLPFVMEQFERQARGEFSVAVDIPVKRKDGSVFYADINATPAILGGRIYIGAFNGKLYCLK